CLGAADQRPEPTRLEPVPNNGGQHAHGDEAGDEVGADQVKRLAGEMVSEFGRIANGGNQVGNPARGDLDHLLREVEAERVQLLPDEGPEPGKKQAGTDPQVEHAPTGARTEEVLTLDLSGGPVEGRAEHRLRIEVVMGGDDLVILALDRLGLHADS